LVETPYSFGQILDWMAQAQLLTELGPQQFLAARKHGVRDITAFLDLGRTEHGRALLRPLLSAADEPDEMLRARIDSIARKLHVRQLEHWWTLLSQALDVLRSDHLVADANVTPLRATSWSHDSPQPSLTVQIATVARKDDAGSRSPRAVLKSGATTASGAARVLGTTYALHDDRFEVDPATGGAYTKAGIDAL
jgi:hypothetical protein